MPDHVLPRTGLWVVFPVYCRSLLAPSLHLRRRNINERKSSLMKKTCTLLSATLLAGGSLRQPSPMTKGTINKMDHDSGKIELQTDRGPAQVYFAPDTVKNLKEGDQVALELET